MRNETSVDATAPFPESAWKSVAEAAYALGRTLGDAAGASRECAEAFRAWGRAARRSRRARQAFRTFRGRLPRGWRKHVRRRKAEERRARG